MYKFVIVLVILCFQTPNVSNRDIFGELRKTCGVRFKFLENAFFKCINPDRKNETDNPKSRVADGRKKVGLEEEHQWFVKIDTKYFQKKPNRTAGGRGNYKESFCGGSIIDTNWILTAAHCFEATPGRIKPNQYKDITIKTIGRRPKNYSIEEIHIPSGRTSHLAGPSQGGFNYKKDIALVKTKEPLPMYRLCLPTGYTPHDRQYLAIGLGNIDIYEPYENYPTQLRYKDITIETCKIKCGSDCFCTFSHAPWSMDSGAPLIGTISGDQHPILKGDRSYVAGHVIGFLHKQVIFLEIYHYISWIRQIIPDFMN